MLRVLTTMARSVSVVSSAEPVCIYTGSETPMEPSCFTQDSFIKSTIRYLFSDTVRCIVLPISSPPTHPLSTTQTSERHCDPLGTAPLTNILKSLIGLNLFTENGTRGLPCSVSFLIRRGSHSGTILGRGRSDSNSLPLKRLAGGSC